MTPNNRGLEPTDQQLAAAWRGAVRDAAVASELQAIFDEAASAIAARGPSCWASGRCCNFEAYGHRLYVTGLEAAWVVVAQSANGELPIATAERAPGKATLKRSLPQLNASAIDDARQRGGCPYQLDNLCSIHTIKPLACRVYFCDRSAQQWQQDLLERLLKKLRDLHDQHALPYRYMEWRDALAIMTNA